MSSPSAYQENLRYLYALQWRGMKLGLRNTRSILRRLGDPHRRFASVHVAGTNGKGSTSAFLASIAREGGLRTGLYTSPHLLRFTERIRLDGEELSEERLVYYVKGLRQAIESVHATFFEAATCIAFQFFADEKVDLAIVETGMGGRFDATNVLLPLASVITSIGLDHTQYLGDTLERIAFEKGGIIKPWVPLVTGTLAQGPRDVLRGIALRRHARFFLAARSAACRVTRAGPVGRTPGRPHPGGLRMRFSSGLARGGSVVPGLPGLHQVRNAQLAAATWSVLARDKKLPAFPSGVVRRGLRNVKENTGLRGRMEVIEDAGGRYILDVGHNPEGIRILVDALRSEGFTPACAVFGAMADKDSAGMLAALRPLVGSLVAVAPRIERALGAEEMARRAREAGFDAVRGSTVAAGLRIARSQAGSGDVLVAGSHYVVAETLMELAPDGG